MNGAGTEKEKILMKALHDALKEMFAGERFVVVCLFGRADDKHHQLVSNIGNPSGIVSLLSQSITVIAGQQSELEAQVMGLVESALSDTPPQ